MTTLVVPSTSSASGVVSYVAMLARAVPPELARVVAVPGSDLASALPAGHAPVAAAESRAGLAAALADHGPYACVQTHGARALLAARRAGVPARRIEHVFHERPRPQGTRGWGEVALAQGTRHAVNSPALAHALRGLGVRRPAVLAPLVAAPALLAREAARERLGLARADVVVGVVGRLDAAKAPGLALAGTSALEPAVRERVTLAFVGDGPLRHRLDAEARRLGVRVALPGAVPGAAALMAAFDCVLVPSRHETFGLALAEAALAGVPVAAVESPGSRLLSGGGALLPLAPPRPHAVAAAIVAALSCPPGALAALRLRVEADFGFERAGAAYVRHFEALSGRR